MLLRDGVPLISDLEALEDDAYYAEITGYSRDFLANHAEGMKGYGKLWGQDPFKLWSRRWEYPYAAQKVLEFGKRLGREDASEAQSSSTLSLASSRSDSALHIIDAGSGVTFFPYFVCDRLPAGELHLHRQQPLLSADVRRDQSQHAQQPRELQQRDAAKTRNA